MSMLRPKLKEIVDLLSELNNAPEPPAALTKNLESYLASLRLAKKKYIEEETFRNFFAELVNAPEHMARQKLNQLPDEEFKKFCATNKIKPAKGKTEKRIKGKVIQKATKAKKATRGNLAQPAVPKRCEPDTIIPAQTARQVTTEIILHQAFQLKSQTTI